MARTRRLAPVNLQHLRAILRPLIVALKDSGTHERLSAMCAELGLPTVSEGSKRDRLSASFDAVAASELPQVAECLLAIHPPSAATRNEIQDLLWEDSSVPPIPKRCRREIARTLIVEELYLDRPRFTELLERLWILDDDELEPLLMDPSTRSLRAQIDRHVFRNPEDWSVEHLMDRLGAFDASPRRFVLFLEGLASSDVRPDVASQRRFVEKVNPQLQACGAELRETGEEGGYPVFTVCALGAKPLGRPKQLIFASSVKPDLRFRDAVNNDIEIVTHADRVLVYDRPIGETGLRWCDLQAWWSDIEGIADKDEAKLTLYRRLKSSLPANSPPQRALFDSFHRVFAGAIPGLPALLPEVWLHWDPKTVRQRGVLALARHRMDFLMLLPHGSRVVLEVDGRHHYADPEGRAAPARYAELAAADRDLKLSGYEVFRFGAEELCGAAAAKEVRRFFERLFNRNAVRYM
jgi:very-short-patch-repair endonuclease